MQKIITNDELSIDDLIKIIGEKKTLFNLLNEKYAFDIKVINMRRGGYIIRFNYDDEHLLFNLIPGENELVVKIRLEPRIVKKLDLEQFSLVGREALKTKRFCQTGYWVTIPLDLKSIKDLIILCDLKIMNYERVAKKTLS